MLLMTSVDWCVCDAIREIRFVTVNLYRLTIILCGLGIKVQSAQ